MPTTAGYVRVSTAMQDADRQREELAAAFEVDRWYADVGSGSDTERDEFQALMADLEAIDVIVVWETSRLTRSLDDLLDILDAFDRHDVALSTLDMLPDYEPNSPMSRAMTQVVAAVMEMEREQIRERIQSGIDRAIENGKHVGRTPFGYMTNANGYLVRDEVEWGVLEDAIDDLMDGRSQAAVARAYEPLTQTTLSRILDRIEDGDDLYADLEFDREAWRLAKARS